MKHILILAIFLLTAITVHTQTYTIKHLGLGEGLSNNYVIDIAEGKDGYLWFATEEGLNKLEGNSFSNYYKTTGKDEQGITGNELNCLLDDPEEPILWIATQREGLNAYNYENNTFTAYRHDENNPNSLATNDVTCIRPSSDGNLWVSTYWKGIDHFNKKNGIFTHYNKETIPKLPENNIWSILEDGKGNLYIGHRHKGLSILSLKNKHIRNFTAEGTPSSIPGNEVICIYQDKAGGIWVGTNKGLALFNPDKKNFSRIGDGHGPLSNRIYDISQLNDKQLWVATEFGGIVILDLSQHFYSATPGTIQYTFIKEGDNAYSLGNASVRCLFQDSFNNIWAGLYGGGVDFLSTNATLFNTYSYSSDRTEHNLNTRIVSSVCVDKQDNLWIGTDGGGINLFKDEQRIATYTQQNSSLKGNTVQTALCDSKGNLWFGLFQKGIAYRESGGHSFKQLFPEELSRTDVRSIYEDKDGIIWIGSSSGVFQINNETKQIIRHINTPNNLVRTIVKDYQGRVWIGTFGGGLLLYSPDLKLLRTFDTFAGFPSNTINYIFEDKSHKLWIATAEGLVCFANGPDSAYRVYNRQDGLENSHIHAIEQDNDGNLWVSTNKGISCLQLSSGRFLNYNYMDNIPQANFTSGSVCKDQNGNLYFGSVNGLCFFYPESVLSKKEAPDAVLTKLTILTPLSLKESQEKQLRINNLKQLKLNYKQNNLSISFCVPNYALADQVEYAYMLKGFGDLWYTADKNNSVTLRNLPPGSYKFMVKTRIRNQEWSDRTITLPITIMPPFWLSWWAKLCYLLLLTAILYILLHAYKRKVNLESLYKLEKRNHEQEQHLNNERLRFFTNITHELRTPLTLIIGPLEDMAANNSLDEKDKHRITVIHKSAVRLLELVNQILEFRKTETQNKKLFISYGNMASVVYEVGLKYKELNRNPEISIQMHTESDSMMLYFDKEAITIILDNLISNALKYTDKGQITISAQWIKKEEVRFIEINVKDTGHGISPEALPHIFNRYYQESSSYQASGTGIGLALVKNLITLHEGNIEVESQPDRGTTFRLYLNAENKYPGAMHKGKELANEKIGTTDEPENAKGNIQLRPVILIVEDNEDILDYIVDSFTDLYEVKTAKNGREGMETALRDMPDLIVSDIMMPVMDGTTMCRCLKDDMRTSHIPIILLTAKDTLTDKEEGYRSGADSYLTKPFSASLLHSRINNLLTQRRLLSERYSSKSNILPKGQTLEEKHAIIIDSLNKLDKEFLDKTTKIITDNLSATEAIDINFLAGSLCMSSSTLYRKIKALTGMSTNEYIRKIKMQLAEKMLIEGKYNISEIAFKVGINSTVYFRQCFKEEFGLTPSEYLRRVKKG